MRDLLRLFRHPMTPKSPPRFPLGPAWRGLILWAVVAMAPGSPLAQDTEVLPPPQSLAPDSTVDVGNLPSAERHEDKGPAPREIKRRRLRDPAGLRQWKELLERAPEAVPPAPGYVGDTR